MSKLFKGLAFLVAVCCLTWVGVLWWWQRNERNLEVQDVVVYLGLLPLVLALLLLAFQWAWRSAGARQAASLATASTASGASSSNTATQAIASDVQSRHTVMQLVHAATCSVTGDQVSDLLEAAHSGKPLPQPDAELTNEEGLPVLCARLSDKLLPLELVRAELERLLPEVQQAQREWVSLTPDEDFVRALSALRQPLQAQQTWLMGLDELVKASLPDGGESLARLAPSQRSPLPAISVLLGWPLHWSAFEQKLARRWVEALMVSPEGDLSVSYALSYSTMAGAGEELWLKVDQMGQLAHAAPWLLVAACHSDIDQSRVDDLSAQQRLYDATSRPGGCIAGEAAAALVLAPVDWVAPEGMDLVTVKLHRPALIRRTKAVEASGKTGHSEVVECLSQALMAAQLEGSEVGLLVSDADQHSPRGSECFGALVSAMAHLDPVEDVRLLGKITGFAGVASWLLVLAAAEAAVKSSKKPTLALGMADSHLRMALVVTPQKEPDVMAD